MNLFQVRQLGEYLAVTQRNVGDSVMSQGGHGGDGGRFLSSSVGGGRYKESSRLAVKTAGSPLAASGIPEGLCVGVQRMRFTEGQKKRTRTFHCAEKLPKRVGIPSRKASNVASSSGVIIG